MFESVIDSTGEAFDPLKHNLLDEPARPQMSKKGKFVKVRADNPNTEDLIERFAESLGKQDGVAPVVVEEPAKPDFAEEVKWAKVAEEVASKLGAAIHTQDGSLLVLQHRQRKAANMANYGGVDEIVAVFESMGLTRD